MRAIGGAVGVPVELSLIVRAILERLAIRTSGPATYRDHRGGPTPAEVRLVHRGPGVIGCRHG